MRTPRVAPHSDGAGVINAMDEGVSPSRIGERIWVWNGSWRRVMDTAAAYIAIPVAHAVPLAANVDFSSVGAYLGIPAMTAFHSVRMAGDVAGKTVLVIGASSIFGYYTAQIAPIKGARVIGAVGSEDKARHAFTAGGAATINYKTERVSERIKELSAGKGVDAIVELDLNTTVKLLGNGALAPHGTLVS